MKTCAITTIDNDFDPFDDFANWFNQDMQMGYNTCGRLAKFDRSSNLMSEQEKAIEHERAIDEMISLDFTHVFVKLERELTNPNLQIA